jgi:hypothetical protein
MQKYMTTITVVTIQNHSCVMLPRPMFSGRDAAALLARLSLLFCKPRLYPARRLMCQRDRYAEAD